MNVYRRNLMKGALAGSTLLTLGLPTRAMPVAAGAGTPARLRLLLGSGKIDAGFAAGARTAFAAHVRQTASGQDAAAAAGKARMAQGGLDVIKLEEGMLVEYEKVARLLGTFRDTRWIAVMDDGSAAVFTELVRNAGGRLVSFGSHASTGQAWMGGRAVHALQLRHVWTAASPAHAAGRLLAARLVGKRNGFSIVENYFSTRGGEEGTADGSLPGFHAWRLEGSGPGHGPAYLYCADISPGDACQLLGWDASTAWNSVGHESGIEIIPGKRRNVSDNDESCAGEWVEAVGYAVVAAALGAAADLESCSVRAHVYQADGVRHGTFGKVAGFTSFVIDV